MAQQRITVIQFRQAQQGRTVRLGNGGAGFTQTGDILVLQQGDDLLFGPFRESGGLGQRPENTHMGDVDA